MQRATFHTAPLSVLALVIGALALLGAMIAVYAGPFAPQPKLGTALGEFTADFITATLRGLDGEAQPAAETRSLTIDTGIAVAVAVAGVVAVVLAVIALARHEPRRLSVGALALGGAALTFQFLAWLALLICGVVLLVTAINNAGAIFESFGG
ncbi:hypothetical protein [Anianabacter salinae]|uniref:hypothetical protein n=1 Tax=Anianabacter salinae TaxID=2851023 RepID=UPI00225DE9ED|nr:hypothetical protein [Anianabacter salinae]MBV0913090.1 hypothetical protein [Anianabacter salinae]